MAGTHVFYCRRNSFMQNRHRNPLVHTGVHCVHSAAIALDGLSPAGVSKIWCILRGHLSQLCYIMPRTNLCLQFSAEPTTFKTRWSSF